MTRATDMATARQWFNEFVRRHEIAWELTMAVLAVAYVIVGILADEGTGPYQGQLETVELALTSTFAAGTPR